MTERQHSVVAMILVIMGLYIMRLAAVEVQPMSEGDIAMRAEAILSSGSWLDPSEHTIGGLSSAATPPLPSWMSAAGIMVLGPTEIGVRILSLLCVVAIMAMTYLLAWRVVPHRHAMMASAIVGLSMPMITAGRQMTPEIVGTCMLLICLWCVVKVLDESNVGTRILLTLLCGWALAGAMLSVVLLSPIALGLLLPLLLRRTTLGYGMLALLFGVALAMPWYAVMFINHGTDVIHAQTVASSVALPWAGGFWGGPLDAVFMLVLASPMLIAAIVWVPVMLRHRDMLPQRGDVVLMSSALWFVALMMITAIGRQPDTTALIAIIPVASIVSFAMLQSAMQRQTPGVLVVLLGCMFSATVTVLAYHIRAVSDPLVLTAGFCLLSIALGLLQAALLPSMRRRQIAVRATWPFAYMAVGATAMAAVLTIVIGNPSTISGGRKVALRLLEDTSYARRFVYLHHGNVSGASVNAQLAWYTRGWMSHKNPRYDFTSLSMPHHDIDEAIVLAGIGSPWIVYCHLGASRQQIARVEELLEANYVVDEDTKNYLLFERRLRVRGQQ